MAKSTFTIGIITPYMDGPYFGGLIYHIHNLVKSQGLRLIVVAMLQKNSNYEVPIAHNRVDGWIVIKYPMNEKILEKTLDSSKKIVGIGHTSEKYPSVLLKNRESMRTGVEHLIKHGHRKIAFVGDMENHSFYERYEGYRDALLDHDIFPDPEWIIDVNYSDVVAGIAAQKFSTNCKYFTGIVACSDVMTTFVMEYLVSNGYKIPQDYALIGFDGNTRPDEFGISLTTINNPVKETAEKAFELLMEQLTNIHDKPKSQIHQDALLVVKTSCGCSDVNQGPGQTTSNINYIRTLNSLEDEIRAHHQISNILASGDLSKIYDLTWLKNKKTKWACFAEWDKQDVKEQLNVISTLSEGALSPFASHIQSRFTPEEFPHIDLISEEMAEDRDNIIALFPIRSANRDWGILCRILRIDDSFKSYRPNTNSSTYSLVLLGAALERLHLFEENQRMTQILENVSSITSDGIWELDLLTGSMQWHTGFKKLGLLDLNRFDYFIERIHPDDRSCLIDYVNRSYSDGETDHRLNCEFRILQSNHEYLWVNGLAKLVRDTDQVPIHIIGSIHDISERKRSEEKINHMAFHDALTQLPNRAYFLQHIQDTIEICRGTEHQFAILLIDIDKFKSINDTYGHYMGDQVLKHVAGILRTLKGPDDIVSRHGGDEFLMLIPHISAKQKVTSICEELIHLFKQPIRENGHEIYVTASIGFSLYPDDGSDLDSLVNNADLAMYLAKSEGRNRYESYKSN